jgi:hypothetical protein
LARFLDRLTIVQEASGNHGGEEGERVLGIGVVLGGGVSGVGCGGIVLATLETIRSG